MLDAIEQFRKNVDRVQVISGLYETLDKLTTPVVDTTDLLRTQIVMIVSALDHYIHEITRIGMLEICDGVRRPTNAFLRFQVALGAALSGFTEQGGSTWLEMEIREKHGYLAFQHPDKIADAVRLFSSCELWPSVASQLGMTTQEVKGELLLIVERRNKIVHEADLNPSYPGSGDRWPISPSDSARAIDFIQRVCEAIHSAVTEHANTSP